MNQAERTHQADWVEGLPPGRRLRVAAVGAGNIARRYHLPGLRRMADEGAPIDLVALCDKEPGRVEEMAARFGFARTYTDYHTLLDKEAPDAVWVLVPIPVTAEIGGFFLRHGVPTLMEKPPGRNSEETRQLLAAAQLADTPNQVAFNRRHAPTLLRMRELLREAGAVTGLSCQFFRHHRGEANFAYGTGLHGLDAMRFLVDAEVVEVHTRPGPLGSAIITLVHDSGALGVMEMLPLVGVQSERYTAHAGERTVVVDGVVEWLTPFPGFLQCFDGARQTLYVDNREFALPPEVASGFYGEGAHFVRSLLRGVKPAPDLATALRSVEIAEAADQAVAEGRIGERKWA